VLKTKEEFRAAVERYRKQLSPEQEAAERKALAEAKKHFAPPLEQTIAQAKKATEAVGEMVRRAADAGKWIDNVHRDLNDAAVTFDNSLALPKRLFETLSRTLSLGEIATASMQLQKSMVRSALSTAAVTKIAVNLAQCATLDLTKTRSGILGIPSPWDWFRRLCEGFSRPKTPKLTRQSNGRPNYIEYAAAIDKLPTTGFWSFQTSSIQLFYGRNSYYGTSGFFPMTAWILKVGWRRRSGLSNAICGPSFVIPEPTTNCVE
jgi:hypothetical protein